MREPSRRMEARQLHVYAEVLNVFDEDGKDIVYFYGANVAGLDPPASRSRAASVVPRNRARSASV